MSVKNWMESLPKQVIKGQRSLTLEEIILQLLKSGFFTENQVREIIQAYNKDRCQPPFTECRVDGILRKKIRYFRSDKFKNYKPRISFGSSL